MPAPFLFSAASLHKRSALVSGPYSLPELSVCVRVRARSNETFSAYSPVFHPRSFIVWASTFKSVIRLKLIYAHESNFFLFLLRLLKKLSFPPQNCLGALVENPLSVWRPGAMKPHGPVSGPRARLLTPGSVPALPPRASVPWFSGKLDPRGCVSCSSGLPFPDCFASPRPSAFSHSWQLTPLFQSPKIVLQGSDWSQLQMSLGEN